MINGPSRQEQRLRHQSDRATRRQSPTGRTACSSVPRFEQHEAGAGRDVVDAHGGVSLDESRVPRADVGAELAAARAGGCAVQIQEQRDLAVVLAGGTRLDLLSRCADIPWFEVALATVVQRELGHFRDKKIRIPNIGAARRAALGRRAGPRPRLSQRRALVLTKERNKGHVVAAMQRLLRDPTVPGAVEEGQVRPRRLRRTPPRRARRRRRRGRHRAVVAPPSAARAAYAPPRRTGRTRKLLAQARAGARVVRLFLGSFGRRARRDLFGRGARLQHAVLRRPRDAERASPPASRKRVASPRFRRSNPPLTSELDHEELRPRDHEQRFPLFVVAEPRPVENKS